MNEEIEQIIEQGHDFAAMLRHADNMEDIVKLERNFDLYHDLVVKNFGVPTDLDEKDSELLAFLGVAFNNRRRCFYPGDKGDIELRFEDSLKEFEDYLDSKAWVK